MAVCCRGTPAEKADFIFSIYDLGGCVTGVAARSQRMTLVAYRVCCSIAPQLFLCVGRPSVVVPVVVAVGARSGTVMRDDLKTLLSHMPVFVVKAIGKEDFGETDTEVSAPLAVVVQRRV